jgi:tetratricopeptide (TPR) repeat protein
MVVAALISCVLVRAQDPQITFRLIVVSSAERAEALLSDIKAGASFEVAARQQSSDPSAERGGLIGPIALSELRPELREAVRGLQPGAVAGVLRLPTGFGLVQRVTDVPASSVRGGEILAVAAVGSVRGTISVDGFSEANTALNSVDKPEDWNQSPRQICELRQQTIGNVKAALSKRLGPELARTRAEFSPNDVMEAHVALAQVHAYTGEMKEAIAQFEAAARIAETTVKDALPDMIQSLGVAHLHKAEMDNDLYRAPGDRCLLSVRGGAPLKRSEDFVKAIDYFTKLLGGRADDIEAKWLLNVSYMATGGYPALLSPRYAMPATDFASPEDVGRFVDVAATAGVDSFSSAGGVIVDDFDNDGQLDILTSNFDSCGRMQLFQRGPNATFVDRAAHAGLSPQLGGLNLLQADYNNDSCKDVLILRGGWELAQRRSLLRNNCDGTFTDVTFASGLARPATSSQTAAWTDIDNDGWVDLFVGNEDAPSQLFRNRGDGTFEDIAAAAGVGRTAFTKAVHAGDVDNDGYPDLYVSNLRGVNFLYRNNRNRTFTDVAASAGVPGADRGFPAWFFDYDNDGWDDLFVSSYFLSIEENARTYMRAVQRQDAEAVSEHGQRPLRGRHRADQHGQGLHADGRELRRHRQRWVSRHLPRHGQPVVCGAEAERAAAQQGREVVRGRHGVIGDRRDAQGPRCGLRRPRQRRRRGDRVQGRRRHAGRRACLPAVRESRTRQRLAGRHPGRRDDESRRDWRTHQGHR